MRHKVFLCLFLGFVLLNSIELSTATDDLGVLTMQPATNMTIAELLYVIPIEAPKAILVLCPGYNGNGREMILQKDWQTFAENKNIGLVAIHFESPLNLLRVREGYYQAAKGSGEILLEGLNRIYGQNLPIYIYGFSGGAHFVTRFIAWKPERIAAWCALGAGVLDQPTTATNNPPGIMACGEDDPRLGGALMFFKQGRAVDKPWLWIEVPKSGHSMSPDLDNFVRSYFASLLKPSAIVGAWVDIDQMKEITAEEACLVPSLSGWLPDRALLESWSILREN